jgi:hypothetical protein
MVKRDLATDVVNGKTYWFSPSSRATAGSPAAYLLPLYDEYLIAYKDRSAALDVARRKYVASRDPFSAPIVVNGQVVGGWRRFLMRDRIAVTLTAFGPLSKKDASAVAGAARAYARFVGLDLDLSWS